MLNIFEKKWEQSGFTLVELLVALVILGLVSVSFLGLYHTGVSGIASAGRKSLDIFFAQEELEKSIYHGTISNEPMTIHFQDASLISIDGEEVMVPTESIEMRTFIPAKN